MARREIFVSVDIEADGPIPGDFSLLSLGAAAFFPGNRVPVATFEINVEPLPGATQDPATMKWWAGLPDAWAHATRDPQPPAHASAAFAAWARALPGDPVLVTYPSWDYMWVHWYLTKFVGRSPFGLAGLDVKSFVMGMAGNASFKGTSKRRMPKRWSEGAPEHTHKALDDAIEQGVVFINAYDEMMRGGGEE